MPLTRKRGRYWYGFTRVNGVSGDEQSTGCKTRAAAAKVLAQWERDAADPHSAAKAADRNYLFGLDNYVYLGGGQVQLTR